MSEQFSSVKLTLDLSFKDLKASVLKLLQDEEEFLNKKLEEEFKNIDLNLIVKDLLISELRKEILNSDSFQKTLSRLKGNLDLIFELKSGNLLKMFEENLIHTLTNKI